MVKESMIIIAGSNLTKTTIFFYVSRTLGGKFKCEEKHKDKALSQILLSLTSSSLAGVHF